MPNTPPRLTVDCVVFGFALSENALKVLLIRRGNAPFAGQWALPGGFVEPDESLDDAARRELAEETGVHDVYLEQLYTFGEPDRDPRGRVVSVAYYALLRMDRQPLRADSDARHAAWVPITEAQPLAFDHDRILATATRRLRAKVRYEPIGFELLPRKFTLSQLQRLYETVLERPIDKRNFRRKILAMGLLEPLEEWQRDVAHRAAQLYRFDPTRYQRLAEQGYNFEL
jgi:8-oxo-dGTP diphosphatase